MSCCSAHLLDETRASCQLDSWFLNPYGIQSQLPILNANETFQSGPEIFDSASHKDCSFFLKNLFFISSNPVAWKFCNFLSNIKVLFVEFCKVMTQIL